MANQIPVKVKGTTVVGDKTLVSLGEYNTGDTLGVEFGGTGATTASDAFTTLLNTIDPSGFVMVSKFNTAFSWAPFVYDSNAPSTLYFNSNFTSVFYLYDNIAGPIGQNNSVFTFQGYNVTGSDSNGQSIQIIAGNTYDANGGNGGNVLIQAGVAGANSESDNGAITLVANGGSGINSSINLLSDTININDTLAIGTPAPNQVTLTVGYGTRFDIGSDINGAGVHDIYVDSTIKLRTLTASSLVKTDSNKKLVSAIAGTDYEVGLGSGTTSQYLRGDKTWQTLNSSTIGLGNVENTALSTWAGTTNITRAGALQVDSLKVNVASLATGNAVTFKTFGTTSSTYGFEILDSAGTAKFRFRDDGYMSLTTLSATTVYAAGATVLMNGTTVGNNNNQATFAVGGFNASTALLFYAGNAEKMRLDTSGRIGLGVTPTRRFHCENSTNGGEEFYFRNTNTLGSAYTAIVTQNDSNKSCYMATFGTGATGTHMGQTKASQSSIYSNNGTFSVGTADNYAFYIGTNSTTRATFDTSGRLAIAQATASSTLDVAGDIETGSANYFYMGDPTTDGSWRIGRSGNNLLSERRESGVWVTKQTITP